MVRAIIFDCFGVLVGQEFEHTYRLAGGNPETDRDFINETLNKANLGLISEDDFIRVMTEKLDISVENWRQAVAEAELPDKQLLGYIKSLRPKYKTAILSNANHGTIARMLGEKWLEDCFDAVLVSAEEGIVKPHPDIYRRTAEKLGVKPSECVFIDDHAFFLTAANSLGMKTILYRNFNQLKTELEALL